MRKALSEKKQTSKLKSGVAVKATRPSIKPGPMDVGLLQQIVELMAAHDLNTVDLRDGENRVVLKRGAVFSQQAPAPVYSNAPQPATAASVSAPAPVNEDENLIPIKSPMVGTFYAAATPEAKAFVSVGSNVNEDTDVCIIEAMKVFNNIKAETRGTIAKVLVTNGQTVEFGQPLYLVKP